MSQIEAIYRGGVFEPLEPVHLCEDERVQLSFEPADGVSDPDRMRELLDTSVLVAAARSRPQLDWYRCWTRAGCPQ
jgi:predicted DNA-binding antitoxin AbrB/MazE fold protein